MGVSYFGLLLADASVAQGAQEEVLYESDRTRVVRRKLPEGQGCVVLKRATGADAQRRLRHERSILQRIGAAPGVARLAAGTWDEEVLALHDDQGVPLGKAIAEKLLSLDDALRIGSMLAKALDAVHRTGVIHKDVNPSNVLLAGAEGNPILIDFNIAAASTEERANFAHEKNVAGTLAYMPPEQTGRTGQVVDHRSDLYALGAVIFQMVAGRTLFETDDLLDLLQHQLTTPAPVLSEVVPGIPELLSALVQRLLEKEPDRRYQSAAGVAHDLDRMRQARQSGQAMAFTLGERDFAARLVPPSRLIGRDAERAQLAQALESTLQHRGACVMVAGAAGVGKTALIDELRSLVADARGWFVTGKFDQHRLDASTATVQALRSLGRLLLAEPEDALARQRERLIEALGSNITAGIARMPEFGLLLGPQPALVAEPVEAERRMVQAIIDALGCIASRERPVVMVLDDTQWAPAVSVRFIDAFLAHQARLPGVLLVLAYRPEEVPEQGELKERLVRSNSLESAPLHLALENLASQAVAELLGEMLRLPTLEASRLERVLGERAHGNPRETIDLVNALRLDGLLEPGPTGWLWDEAAIGRYVGENDGVDLLAKRLGRLPDACVSMLETLACLGGNVRLAELEAALDDPGRALEILSPALDDGLIVVQSAGDEVTLCLYNSRLQECLLDLLVSAGRQVGVRLALARRLALHEDHLGQAAQQYLEVSCAIDDPAEARRAALLMRDRAVAQQVGNYAACERFADAAIKLLEPIESPDDQTLMISLLQQRHQVLYGMGRHEEAHAAYLAIESRCGDPHVLQDAAGVQLFSLTAQARYAEAYELGLSMLARLGLSKPDDVTEAIATGLRELAAWALGSAKQADLTRPETQNPQLRALMHFIPRMQACAFEADRKGYAWLILQAHRLWTQHGPSAALMTSAGSFAMVLLGGAQDYRAAHAASRHALAVSQARGYGGGASTTKVNSAMCTTHWGDDLEEVLQQARSARKPLMEAVNTLYAGYSFTTSTAILLETRTLEEAAQENAEEYAYKIDTNNKTYLSAAIVFRQLIRALRGETAAPGSFDDADFDEARFVRPGETIPSSVAMMHSVGAMTSLIFGDHAELRRHVNAAIALRPVLPGSYVGSLVQLYEGMLKAQELRDARGENRDALLADIDACRAFLSQRAVDAPSNYAHLSRLLDAERAWCVGDLLLAARTFDLAIVEAEGRERPWHLALTLERAARFNLANGWERAGRQLMEESLQCYARWGAAGKVRALRREFPKLRRESSTRTTARTSGGSTLISSDAVDMMAILRASQALSSETSLKQLNASVSKVLSALCGAESVLLAVQLRDTQDSWVLATSLEPGAQAVTIEQAAAEGKLAISALRYVARTREPLLLEDATRDDRFSSDPALATLEHCSLLVVPILKQGELQGLLMLENRMRRGAFSADRLDAVSLIAGQLAVSLDNALLYASLERKVAERTAELEEANRLLERLSVTDALTGLANRRHFNQALEIEWARAARAGSPVGVAMIDIDQFKQYNDHYGHQGGDTCLKLVADAMKSVLRSHTDLVARYGGEEFVLLLRDSDLEATRVVAERVRAAVAAMMEPHEKSTHGIVTISVGIASCVPQRESNPLVTLEAADGQLYHAKREGRNRVAPL